MDDFTADFKSAAPETMTEVAADTAAPEPMTDAAADTAAPNDLYSEVARLAALDPIAFAAAVGPVAKALDISRTDLKAAVNAWRRQQEKTAKAAAADAAAEEAPADAAPLPPDKRDAEVARLAALSFLDYQAERSEAAQRLGLGVGALDKAVNAARAREHAARQDAHREQAPPEAGEVREPYGFVRRPDGLYGDTGGDEPLVWLTGPFDVLGETRDQASNEWGLWLRWSDGDAKLHTLPLPAALVHAEPGRVEQELAKGGLHICPDPGARLMLRRYLGEVRSGSRVRIAYACGWQGSNADAGYLMPDGEVLGDPGEHVVLHAPAADAAQRCGTGGSLAGWQAEVAALAEGNPLAAFCLAAAFAGPLLLPAGEPGGGFHLAGPSKRGKTLAMQIALSAWGLPYKAGGALRDWRATANGLEVAGEEASDGLLTLDELHQADPAQVAQAAYMLADGSGKGRLNRDASARRRRTWMTFILSTGEPDLAAHVAKAGQRLPAGAEVRLPSIQVADAGEVWPALHGRADFGALATDFHNAMRRNHGHAARAFIERLAAECAAPPGDLAAMLAVMRERMAVRLPAGADPQVRDVARRCALVAVAGELAAAWGILPWPAGEAERAAAAILLVWLARRPGGAGATEAAAQLERVRAVLIQHAARFTLLCLGSDGTWQEADPLRPVLNRIGWRKRHDGRDEFLVPPELWRAEVCGPAGLDPAATARALAAGGFLRRGEGNNLMPKERLPGIGAKRVYAISAALVENVEDAGERAPA